MSIPLPENLQLQSPLFNLPAEIKNAIYAHCFDTDEPIVDAVIGGPRPDNGCPKLGLSILQTCRLAYYEADRRPLFAQNRFRFSNVDRVRGFFGSLDKHVICRESVRDIEIDAQHISSNRPPVARDWVHYLGWEVGNWGKISPSSRVDSPGLKCLRLNFESWPFIKMYRSTLWDILRKMLEHVEGLERVVVTGASRGRGMIAHAPWSPVHFVGGDDVGSDDLVELMWKAVRGGDSDLSGKVVRWERRDGKMSLEVTTKKYLVEHVDQNWVGPRMRKNHTDAWPENGSCTWFAYQNRDYDVIESTMEDLSPSALE